MRITYDPYADAMYVYMQQKKKSVAKTEEVRPDLLLDIGKNGELLGIEILDISAKLPKAAATSLQVELNVQKPTPFLPTS